MCLSAYRIYSTVVAKWVHVEHILNFACPLYLLLQFMKVGKLVTKFQPRGISNTQNAERSCQKKRISVEFLTKTKGFPKSIRFLRSDLLFDFNGSFSCTKSFKRCSTLQNEVKKPRKLEKPLKRYHICRSLWFRSSLSVSTYVELGSRPMTSQL